MHPPNWTRSRIRRQHLITLGVPVNLDEVLPHASSKPLPALRISGGRPMSAPPISRNGSPTPNGRTTLRNSRAGTPVPSPGPPTTGSSRNGAAVQLGLGPKPQLDELRIGELLALKPGMHLCISRDLHRCQCWPGYRSTISTTVGVLGSLFVRTTDADAEYISTVDPPAPDERSASARLGNVQ